MPSSRRRLHRLIGNARKANNVYSYTFRNVIVGMERTKREAKRIAVKNVRDYFDIMIEKEILDGASK